jgi:hypothetical protein
MSQKGVPYDLTNFFLSRDKVFFYISLGDVENKKAKMHDVCRRYKISRQHMKLILMALKHYKLLDFRYDQQFKSFIPVFTEKGRKLREMLIAFIKFFEDMGVWKNGLSKVG